MLSKLIIGIIISISMRNAAIQPNPIDYEFVGGFEGEYCMLKTKFEREDGLLYRGLKFKTKEYKKTVAELEIDEANNINRQYVYKTLLNPGDADIIKIRSTNAWVNWGYQHWLGGIEFDLSTNKLIGFKLFPNATFNWQYDTNLMLIHISRLKYSFNLIDQEKFVLRPVYNWNSYNGRKNWQFKTELEIIF